MLQILKIEEEIMKETKPAATKYASFGATIAAELMFGFWFGTGTILAVGVADGLNYYYVGSLTSNK